MKRTPARQEGTITKDQRDRRLKRIVDELAANQRRLNDLVETPLPTYAEWQSLMQPFQKGFAGLPADEKRRVITSRFQQISVKDYRVVSLYLLTGDIKTPEPIPQVETDPARWFAAVG